MANENDDDVLIKIEDTTTQQPTNVERPGETRAVVVETKEKPDSAVEDLAKQYKEMEDRAKASEAAAEEARRRAAASENEAQEAIRMAEAAKAAAASSNLDTINTALSSATSEVEAAKRDIKLAGESGDYAALADAQERLSKASALALRYDEAKADLEARSKQQKPEPRRPQNVDPVESYIQGRSEPTARWLREHKDWITDTRKNAKLTAAHHNAIAEGIAVDSQEYFDSVERFIGLKKDGDVQVAQHSRKAPSKAVAPANGSGGNNAISGGEVRLTRGEAAAATDGTLVWNYDVKDGSGRVIHKKGEPIGLQEMAKRKLDGQRRGAYDRSYEVQ